MFFPEAMGDLKKMKTESEKEQAALMEMVTNLTGSKVSMATEVIIE